MSPIETARVVEVIVRSDGRVKYGSGYRISSRLVLTVAHLLYNGDEECRNPVCTVILGGHSAELSATPIWRGGGRDLALFRLGSAAEVNLEANLGMDTMPPIVLGLIPKGVGSVPFIGIGFPAFAQRPASAKTRGLQRRDSRQVSGFVQLGSNIKSGLLDLTFTTAPPAAEGPDGQDPWQGISGTALFTQDGSLLIGVQAHRLPAAGTGSAEAEPIAEALNSPQFVQLLAAHGVRPQAIQVHQQELIAEQPRPLVSVQTARTERSFAPARPEAGRPVEQWNPVMLGVHKTLEGGPLSAYVRRVHDDVLYGLLDPDSPANRLVVLRGGSSTGKSRAAYEGVFARLPDWPLYYPRTAAALSRQLKEGLPRRSVLWLNELRHYADDPSGSEALFGLADLLDGWDHIVVITALWPEYWRAYITDHPNEPGIADRTRAARGLLAPLTDLSGQDIRQLDDACGGVIEVPDDFTSAAIEQARRSGDPTLKNAITAAERAGYPGRIAQYLAGVPDLLGHYQGPGADPYGQALITAAMDITRLCGNRLMSRKLLQTAAVSFFTDQQRTVPTARWENSAWAYATRVLRGAIQPLEPVPPEHGVGVAGYRLADYLDQYGSIHRADQILPIIFWAAAATHTAIDNAYGVGRLLEQLRTVGADDQITTLLTRDPAAQVPLDNPHSVAFLLGELAKIEADDQITTLAGRAATHVSLDNPNGVGELLAQLIKVGADGQIATLLARDPAAHVSVDVGPDTVAGLLAQLIKVGADDQITTLAGRAATHVSLDNPNGVAGLLAQLIKVGADGQIATLLARDPAAHVSVDVGPDTVAGLLAQLIKVGADDQITTLAGRAATHVSLDNPNGVAGLLAQLIKVGADGQIATLLARDPAAHVSVDVSPDTVAGLLAQLRRLGADDQIVTLLARDPAAHVSLDNPNRVASLLAQLCGLKADGQIATLLARDPAGHVSLDVNPDGVAYLLDQLRGLKADGQVARLLARDPAGHVSVDVGPGVVAYLLDQLRGLKADGQIARLLARDPAGHVSVDVGPDDVAYLLTQLRKVKADGQVARLLARDPAGHVSVDVGPDTVAYLLDQLRGLKAGDQIATLLARDPAAHVSLHYSNGVARLLDQLLKVKAGDQIATLLARDPAGHVSVDVGPNAVARLLTQLRKVKADGQVARLLARDPAGHVSVDVGPNDVAYLLDQLRGLKADDQVARLLARDPAGHVSVDVGPNDVAYLLDQLRGLKADDQVARLLARDPATHVSLDVGPDTVAYLLYQLRGLGADDQIARLLARDPATHVSLDNANAVARLLDQLLRAEADDQIATLLARDPAAHVSLDNRSALAKLTHRLRRAGADAQVTTLAKRLNP